MIVFVRAVLTSGMFLAEISHLQLPSSSYNKRFVYFQVVQNVLEVLCLDLVKFQFITTMNLFSSTLEVSADLRAALFSFLFILKE